MWRVPGGEAKEASCFLAWGSREGHGPRATVKGIHTDIAGYEVRAKDTYCCVTSGCEGTPLCTAIPSSQTREQTTRVTLHTCYLWACYMCLLLAPVPWLRLLLWDTG